MAGPNYQFPVYQIDFSAAAAGKRVAATKRRIRWRFGFPNIQALEAGRTGTDCRGEEHEVVIVWSITSGKRQILMDGREVHYSANRIGTLDFSWNTKGNHVLKTMCHAAPPMTAVPGFRQYDLSIDGQSFFNMPKVYELGIKGSAEVDNRVPGRSGHYGDIGSSPRSYGGNYEYGSPTVRPPRTEAEEDTDLKRAIQASLEESKQHLGEQAPDVLSGNDGQTTDLLGFDGPPTSSGPPALMPTPSMTSFTSAPQHMPPSVQDLGAPPPQQDQQFAALPPTQPGYGGGAPPPPQQPITPIYSAPTGAPPQQQPQQQFLALPPTQPGYGAPPPPPPPSQYSAPAYAAPSPANQYAPPPPANQFAPPPTYGGNDSHPGHAIDDPFAPRAPSRSAVANDILKAYGATTPTSVVSNGFDSPQGHYQPGQPFPQEQPSQSGNPVSMNGGLAVTNGEETPQNPFDQALKKLVNFDHIDEPAEEQVKLTMKKQEVERSKKNMHKSVPLPPAAARMVGSGATLGDISKVKPTTEKKNVMVPPPNLFQGDAAAAGMLVVHGEGPPPLRPKGFGVVHMQGQYPAQAYGNQRQQGYGYR